MIAGLLIAGEIYTYFSQADQTRALILVTEREYLYFEVSQSRKTVFTGHCNLLLKNECISDVTVKYSFVDRYRAVMMPE